MQIKHLAGLLLPLYCAALLALVVVLSHYPQPQEAHETEVEIPFSEAPPEFKTLTDIAQRKQAFFEYLRPMIHEQNRQLSQKRQHLLQLQAKIDNGESLSVSERRALNAMAARFAVEEGRPSKTIANLLLKVDAIPEAMALAQAASESAWGTSRFAREGHNYFGQWCYTPGCGLVPSRRATGAAHEVAAFDSPYESVKGYFHNINTHRAYRELRLLRQQKTASGEPLTARALLPGLRRYSERGQDYINELLEIIRFNQLEDAAEE